MGARYIDWNRLEGPDRKHIDANLDSGQCQTIISEEFIKLIAWNTTEMERDVKALGKSEKVALRRTRECSTRRASPSSC